MLDIFDKSIMLDQVMPRVFRLENNEPGVLMAVLGMYASQTPQQSTNQCVRP